jgi:hypothetical protein
MVSVPNLTVTGIDSHGYSAELISYNGNLSTGNSSLAFKTSRGTLVAPTAVQSGDVIGNADFYGHTGSSFQYAAAIDCVTSNIWTPTNTGSQFNFSLTPVGTTTLTIVRSLTGLGLETILTNGDQTKISLDTSSFREGTQSTLASGTAYALVSSQPIMYYWSHNTALSAAGSFTGVDVTGTSMFHAYLENDLIQIYSAPSVATGVVPTFGATPTYSFSTVTGNLVITGSLKTSTTAGIVGTVAADAAAAGSVGEVISSSAVALATGLTTATPLNVVSIALTGGDWDVWGSVVFTGVAATTSFTITQGGINSAGNTLPATHLQDYAQTAAYVPAVALYRAFSVPQQRVNFTGSQTWYLVAQATFTAGTAGAGGTIYARRRR